MRKYVKLIFWFVFIVFCLSVASYFIPPSFSFIFGFCFVCLSVVGFNRFIVSIELLLSIGCDCYCCVHGKCVCGYVDGIDKCDCSRCKFVRVFN